MYRYILILVIMFLAIACSKNEQNEERGDTIQQSSLPIEKAVFTDPRKISNHKESDISLMDGLIRYLNYAPKGSVVHINIFTFTYKPILYAITEAFQRGVTIKILIDNEHGYHTANEETISILQNVLESPSKIIPVNNDARPSDKAIDHNKYVLFSEVDLPKGVAKHLVWAGSHNFTLAQTKDLQDAVIMTNKSLYDAFLNNWNQIKDRARQGMKYFTYSVVPVGDSIVAFFFPRRKNGKWDNKNTIIEQLNKLSVYTEDTIRVLMAGWHASEGVRIAQKLIDLAKEGVTVQVITHSGDATSDVVRSLLKSKLPEYGGYVKILDPHIIHSKTMLIKGVFDGKMQNIVLTGCLNYHTHAINSNNNFLLMLKDNELFDDYWNNWEMVGKLF